MRENVYNRPFPQNGVSIATSSRLLRFLLIIFLWHYIESIYHWTVFVRCLGQIRLLDAEHLNSPSFCQFSQLKNYL